MAQSTTLIPKKRGPKPKGAVGIMVRMPPEALAPLDAYIATQPDAPSRPEAIRRLIELGLKAANQIPVLRPERRE